MVKTVLGEESGILGASPTWWLISHVTSGH